MATKGAALQPQERRGADRADRRAPEVQSPAAPIARGIGLDQPFFDDKNRAFWILQSVGWTGYFLVRSISALANGNQARILQLGLHYKF